MDTHFAYLAGIIDGEGTITIHKHRQYGRATYQLRPRLIVSNIDLGMLTAIKGRHGGSIILQRARAGRWREHYLWRVCRMEAICQLVAGVRPYLITKADRADVLLEFLRSRLAVHGPHPAPPYSDREFELFEALRKMNRKGETMSAEVTRRGALSMQVCVPSDWTDEQVKEFADRENLCGTEHGWHIRKEGDPALAGDPERCPCHDRAGHVHIMLDA